MQYYNAIVYTDYNTTIIYHQISKPQRFVEYCLQNISVTKIFFYKLPFRTAKKGTYAGYYFANRGVLNVT